MSRGHCHHDGLGAQHADVQPVDGRQVTPQANVEQTRLKGLDLLARGSFTRLTETLGRLRAVQRKHPRQHVGGGGGHEAEPQLTDVPSRSAVSETDIQAVRASGFGDGEILEINQVMAYFADANRTVLGVGITTDGDDLGTAPTESDGDTE